MADHDDVLFLAEVLKSRFEIEDLRGLCFSLGIDHEDALKGEGKSAKVRSLVGFLESRDRLIDLVNEVILARESIPELNRLREMHGRLARESSDQRSLIAAVSEPQVKLAARSLHEEYLRHWFSEPWAKVPLADLTGEDRDVALLDVYVPLRVDFSLTLKIDDRKIVDWWVKDERAEAVGDKGAALEAEAHEVELMRKPRLRAWPSLGVDEAELQRIVDAVQRNRLDKWRDEDLEKHSDEEIWFMEAHDAASVQSRFVLVGEPGSGKSSFVRHLALCLAGAQLREMGASGIPDNASLDALRDWLLGSYTPIFLELADIVKQVFPPLPAQSTQKAKLPAVDDFWRYVRAHMLKERLAPYEAQLLEALRSGEAILLLDGLDEVSEATDERRAQQIKTFVGALSAQYPQARFIVTSRPHAYQLGGWSLDGFGRAELRPLSLDRLMELARALFGRLIPEAAENEAKAFGDVLREVPDDLRRNPLFFTLLAAIWLRAPPPRRLPATRAELYRTSVDLMLSKWTALKGAQPTVAEQLGLTPEQLRIALQILACRVHGAATSADDTVEFHRKEFQDVIEDIRRNAPASDALDYLEQRAGLLISGRPKHFRFAHRSFQEHLAACELTHPPSLARTPAVADENVFPAGLTNRALAKPDVWRNVAFLAADELALKRRDDLRRMLLEMIRPELRAQDAASLQVRQASTLALEIVREHDLLADVRDEFSPGAPLMNGLRQVALRLLTDLEFGPEQRLIAGMALSTLGDPRPGVGLRPDGVPDIDWVEVPDDGEFIYGEGEGQRQLRLPPFKISRYPITCRQFQAFVDAPDGFSNPRWWEGLSAGAEHRQRPGEQRFQFWNHPRERVSWYDAVAFCRWLSARLGIEVRLPKEEEWEKAARGRDGRIYPWGNDYIAGYANIDETYDKIGPYYLQTTSAVGMYPQGRSPYGLMDMSGNVWGWCLNEYENPTNTQLSGKALRVVRGGAWDSVRILARAVVRFGGNPDGRYDFIGFRLVRASAPVP
jgi:formylglycine-generating enzyme required for sulfatase activity